MKSFLSLAILGLSALLFSGCCNCGATNAPTPVTPEPPGGYVYLTLEDRTGGQDDLEIYVTNQPIRGVTYSEVAAGTGDYSDDAYNFGTMTTSYWGYATTWSDGSVTYSDGPYEGVTSYNNTTTAEYNHTIFNSNGSDDELLTTDEDNWYVGTETTGHVPEDYEYRAYGSGGGGGLGGGMRGDGHYVLIGTPIDTDTTGYTSPIGDTDDIDADDVDSNYLPNEIDGIPLSGT
jgi:hypothetical protein